MTPIKYRPIKTIDKRKRNSYIILSHIKNFSHKNYPLTPELQGYVPYYCSHRIRNYYSEQLNKSIPFHYHVNKVLHDWEVTTMLPLNTRSTFLDKCFENGYIDFFYKDAIVIAIQDNYATRIPDNRTYEVLGSNVIAPLKDLFKMGNFYQTVVFIDEIFNIDKYNKDLEEDPFLPRFPYKFHPMKYFDRTTFNIETLRFASN